MNVRLKLQMGRFCYKNEIAFTNDFFIVRILVEKEYYDILSLESL